ncbi:MAG: BamA/TamA family outer membrane protein [Steroidobacteraceae bacterium]
MNARPTAPGATRRAPATPRAWPRAAGLALLALAALQPGHARAEVDIEVEGVDPELRRNVLVFLSLERYKARDDIDEALMDRLQERAVREATAALRPFGYYEPKVQVDVSRSGARNWRARVQIEPGPPVLMDKVEISVLGPGATDPAFTSLTRSPPLRSGDRLSHAAYDTLKTNLQRTAATLGYMDARLTRSELSVDPPNHRASAALVLETGFRYRFGATTIEQKVINETVLRRYMRYHQDEPYDATELLRTQFALDDSQYFATVEVLPGDPDRELHVVPVSIRAEANRRERWTFGFGYGTDTKLRGTIGWENRRVNARGHRFRAELKAAQVNQSVIARYVIPIGDPALEKLTGEFSYERSDLGDLDTRTTKFQPSITQVRGQWQRVLFTSLTRTTTITGGGTRATKTEAVDTLVIPGISFASVPRGYLGEALFSRTLYTELRGSTTALGAPANYAQLRIEGERVVDFARRWHLHGRAQLGASLINRTEDLPGTERFFAGGDRSVRGFGYNDLSPIDATGAKVGGKHVLTGTLEVIRDLPRNLGLALFADAGNAFDRFGDPLQYSVGIGIRLRLPVVTLGIDVAQPLTNPRCHAVDPDPRCAAQPGFDSPTGPRLHLNFSPKL